MKPQVAYCSACDRDVRIVITDEPSQDGHANLHDTEVVCLEIDETCTGALCPIGATSPTVMAARLVRNELGPVVHPIIEMPCTQCERPTPHFLVGRDRATCSACGVTAITEPR